MVKQKGRVPLKTMLSNLIMNPYYGRGYAYGCQSNYKGAITDYTKAIELKPIMPIMLKRITTAAMFTSKRESPT